MHERFGTNQGEFDAGRHDVGFLMGGGELPSFPWAVSDGDRAPVRSVIDAQRSCYPVVLFYIVRKYPMRESAMSKMVAFEQSTSSKSPYLYYLRLLVCPCCLLPPEAT